MEQRKKLLEEREQLKKEYTERLKIQMNSFNKLNDLLPKFRDTLDGVMATFTMELLAECDKADKEEQEASAKLRETFEKICEINTKLQA